MKTFAIALVALIGAASLVSAQNVSYEKYWNGHQWAYRQCATCAPTYVAPAYVAPAYVAPVVKENKTTVINNLIGIPVPVQYTQPITGQGTTVYGYSSVAEAYGNVDLGLLYNQAARLTDQAQQLAGQAATDFQTLVQAEGQNRAEVAKIIAQGQAAREALLATRGSPSGFTQQSQFRAFTFKVTQDSSGAMKVEQVPAGTTMPAANTSPDFNLTGNAPQALKAGNISEIIKNKCVSCHGSDKASGGLNFLQPITDAQQAAVLERITTTDAVKRMPLKGTLTVAETNAFFQAMGTPQK
jgi:mono/diheme cytochrome c family protein